MTGGVRPSIECGIRSGPPMEDRFGAGEGQGLFSLPPTHTCPLYFSALQYDHYGLYCPGPLPHLPWQRLTNGRHWQDTEVRGKDSLCTHSPCLYASQHVQQCLYSSVATSPIRQPLFFGTSCYQTPSGWSWLSVLAISACLPCLFGFISPPFIKWSLH